MRKANQGKSGVQKNPPSGGTSRREAAASRMLRVQRNDMRNNQPNLYQKRTKRIRRQAEHPAARAAASRMLRVQRNDMRKANQGKSGVQKKSAVRRNIPPRSGCLTHVARSAQRYAQTPAPRNQERYRTAGRVLQERADRSVLVYVTGGSNAARRAPAKRDRSVHKKKFRHRATLP